MRRQLFLLLVPVASLLLGGCASENLEELADPCDSNAVATYSAVIQPIIQTNCLRCHGPGGTGTLSSGYQLDSYTGLKRAADVKVAGQSLLVGVVDHQPGFSQMPKDLAPSKISACDISKIKRWVDAGALNN